MRIIAKKTLQNFWEQYPNSKQPLLSWYQVFDRTVFYTPNDIKAIFGSADFVGDNKIIFNICGNHYRLIVKVNYATEIVYILFVWTWIPAIFAFIEGIRYLTLSEDDFTRKASEMNGAFAFLW